MTPLHRSLVLLLIEDSAVLSELTVELIRDLGHEVVPVYDAEAALAMLETRHFDAVLADVSLPGMSGVEFARTALARWPGLPIIIATGLAEFSQEMLRRAVDQSLFALVKPYTSHELERLLDGLPEHRAEGGAAPRI